MANEDVLREINRSGVVTTLSGTVGRFPEGTPPFEEFQKHLAGAKDMLALTAVDPNGVGLRHNSSKNCGRFRAPAEERAAPIVI